MGRCWLTRGCVEGVGDGDGGSLLSFDVCEGEGKGGNDSVVVVVVAGGGDGGLSLLVYQLLR